METSKQSWILLQNIYGLIIGYVSYLIIFRHAGVFAFGVFSFALSFGLIFSFVSDLGINTAHTRMIAAGKDKNEYNNALILMKILLTGVYIAAIFLLLAVWVLVLHRTFDSRYVLISILYLVPYFISLPYIQANRAFFTGTMEAAKMSIPAIVESTVRLVSIVVLVEYNIFRLNNVGEMALVIAVSYSISYAAYALLSFVVGMPWHFKWPKRETISDYLKYSYPLMGAAVAAAISTNLAQILIQLFYDYTQLGGYSGDLRLITLVTGFTTSVTILILPMLTSHYGTREEYGIKVGLMVKYLALFITPITVFVITFASPVLNLWVGTLIPFTFPLRILLVGSWFTTMSIPFWTHFNAIGKTKISGGVNILSFLLIIILDLILIPGKVLGLTLPGLGVAGAAWASLISGITLFALSIYLLLRELRISVPIDAVKSVALSVVAAIPFYFFYRDVIRLPAIDLLGLFVGYSLLYVAILLASRTLSRQEVIDILNMVNVKKIIKYAIDEFRKSSQ